MRSALRRGGRDYGARAEEGLPIHDEAARRALAKGRLLGLQFDTLFTDDLYFRISKHAINMAMQIRDAFDARGLQFYLHSPTNLQFLIMENKAVRALQQKIAFHTWGKVDEEHSVARFATSWSTTQEDVDALIDAIKTL